jgi:hypothetical protein
MQNAKNAFYLALRDRLVALNPARQVVIRGQSRPALVVDENEVSSPFDWRDTFRMRWTELALAEGPLPLATLRCEFHYATSGSTGNGGMDRGRLLAAMDAELAAIVNTAPQRVMKQQFANEDAAMRTNVFWSDLAFAPVAINGELLERSASVDVYAYQEAGER